MKPKDSAYPKSLRTLGDRLRARRLDLGLLQTEVAARLGIDKGTIANWEQNRTEPALRLVPRLVAYLGQELLDGVAPEAEGQSSRPGPQGAACHARRTTLPPRSGQALQE